MTRRGARTGADVILGVAGVVAAYVVMTTPPLRRLAARAVRVWLGATASAYLVVQLRDAWMESSRAA
jgi:hypothetical protein